MVDPTERRWRAKAASIESAALAGLAHAALLTASLVLLQFERPSMTAGDAEIQAFLADPDSRSRLLVAQNLMPLSVIAFLWFIAVIRRRIGDREDKFFSSVFLGSGLVLAGLFLVGSAAHGATAVMSTQTGRVPDADSYRLMRSAGQAILSVSAPRLGAVFILATSNLGRRTGALPRWLVLVGLVAGVAMVVDVTFSQPIPYVFPAWVALVSLALLFRQTIAATDLEAGDEV